MTATDNWLPGHRTPASGGSSNLTDSAASEWRFRLIQLANRMRRLPGKADRVGSAKAWSDLGGCLADLDQLISELPE